jgi:hypothetical protein
MQQIAIDLGGRKSQVCARSSDGEILEERSCETRSLRAYLRETRWPPSLPLCVRTLLIPTTAW